MSLGFIGAPFIPVVQELFLALQMFLALAAVRNSIQVNVLFSVGNIKINTSNEYS